MQHSSNAMMRPSRRQVLRASLIGGIAVYLAPLGTRAFASLFEDQLLTRPAWNSRDGVLKYRVDGTAKVTGEKVFARDIRARDMPHWPRQQAHALVLRVTMADRRYAGFNLSPLGSELKPDRIVTATDLKRDGIEFPIFYGEDVLLPEGQTPAYLGQAVAILIYQDFARFRFAKEKVQFNDAVVRYGEVTGPLQRDPWGSSRFVRVGGKTAYDEDVFSAMKHGPISPSYDNHEPVWPKPGARWRCRRAGHVSRQSHRRRACASARRLAGPDARLRHAVGRYRSAGARLRQCLVRCGQAGTASGRTDAIATGSGGGRCEHAGQKPRRAEAIVPASVLHGRLWLERSLHHAVLWSCRLALRRRPAGAARQRSFRTVPGRPEAAPVQHGLHRRSRPAYRLAAIVSGQHCRQWRRPRELLRRPHHGGRHLGPVGLLFSEERRGRHRDRIARHRLRCGARLWRARNFDGDRADDRRDRRRTRPRSDRVPSAQRVEDRNEDRPGCDPARDATRRGGAGKVAGARAVGWPRGSQAGV